MDRMKIAERIIEIRKNNKLSQDRFAEMIGCSSSTIAKIEQAKGDLSSDVALKISEKYGLSLDWIYGKSDTDYNKASKAVDVLQEILKFTTVEKELLNRYDQIRCVFPEILIDEALLRLLLDIDELRKLVETNKIDLKAYNISVDALKDRYNESYVSNEEREKMKFVLVEEKYFAAEDIKVDELYEDFISREYEKLQKLKSKKR